jgi:hypothetical protein
MVRKANRWGFNCNLCTGINERGDRMEGGGALCGGYCSTMPIIF